MLKSYGLSRPNERVEAAGTLRLHLVGPLLKRPFVQLVIRHRLSGALRCVNVLHYQKDWHYVCAMLIGYARVSTNEQDTTAQAAEFQRARFRLLLLSSFWLSSLPGGDSMVRSAWGGAMSKCVAAGFT